jgi:hypothetical protein
MKYLICALLAGCAEEPVKPRTETCQIKCNKLLGPAAKAIPDPNTRDGCVCRRTTSVGGTLDIKGGPQ